MHRVCLILKTVVRWPGCFFETVKDIQIELVTELVIEALLVDADWGNARR